MYKTVIPCTIIKDDLQGKVRKREEFEEHEGMVRAGER